MARITTEWETFIKSCRYWIESDEGEAFAEESISQVAKDGNGLPIQGEPIQKHLKRMILAGFKSLDNNLIAVTVTNDPRLPEISRASTLHLHFANDDDAILFKLKYL